MRSTFRTLTLLVATLGLLLPAYSQRFGGGGRMGGGGFGGGRSGGRMGGGFGGRNGRGIQDVPPLEFDDTEGMTTRNPFGTAVGKVTDKDGKPATGIVVTFDRQDIKGEYKTKTNPKGEYNFTGLAGGTYRIGVVVGDQAGLLKDISIRNGHEVTNDFDLKDFVPMGKPGEYDALRKKYEADRAKADAENKMSSEVQALYEKGMDALLTDKFEDAVKYFKATLEKSPDNGQVWGKLGESYGNIALHKDGDERLKTYDEACAAFRKAMELRPDVADFPGLLSLALVYSNKMDEAAVFAQKTADLDRDAGAEAFFNIGAAQTNRGNVKEAEAAYRKSTELSPAYPDSWLQLGITLLSSPNPKDAIPALERFLKLLPKNSLTAQQKEDGQTAKDLIDEIKNPAATGFKLTDKK